MIPDYPDVSGVVGKFSERQLREYEFPEQQWIIEGEIPVATYTMIMAAPKVGKTMLTLPLAQDLADAGWRVHYAAMDDSPRRMQNRSMKSSPDKARDNLTFAGTLEPGSAPEFWTPTDMAVAFAELKAMLLLAQLAGDPIDIVFIDTYGVFTSGAGRSADGVFKGDYAIGAALKKICAEFNVAIIANHHARKRSGDDSDWVDMVNGSSGVTASLDQIWYLTGTRGSNEGVLHQTGNDIEGKAIPLVRDGQMMRWNPDPNITAAMAERTGVPRAILDMLTETRYGISQADMVVDLDQNRNTIKSACQRLQAEGIIRCIGTEWSLDESHPSNRPVIRGKIMIKGEAPAAEGRTAVGPCTGCGLAATYQYGQQPWHVLCKQAHDDAQALDATTPELVTEGGQAGRLVGEPQPAAETTGSDDATEAEHFKAFKSLEESIRSSRKHPVPLIARDKRDNEPWTLITERMSGEHRHRIDAPDGSTVKVLDRRGSYPSAMSNVPVSANLLSHTGPMSFADADKTRAGIYQIQAFRWEHPSIGHPLGKIAQEDSPTWWITTPHLRLLERLVVTGHLEPDAITIVDSWTGLTATNLFEGFYKDVREARKATIDDEPARAEVKRMSSVAIRALWLKNDKLRSPFWRPDWSVSVRAEASVRHWMRAWQAVQAGGQLVALRNVDEAAFVVPDGVPLTSWVPEPYKVGEDYGNVSVKNLLTSEEWNGGRR